MQDFIYIVLASDDNYIQHAAVTIVSILKNTAMKNKVKFFILNQSITANKKLLVEKTVQEFSSTIEWIDIDNKDIETVFVSGHISKAAYFRLMISEILPAYVKKVIYLDVDLLVYKDIAELWNFEMENKPLAAVADYGIMGSRHLCKQKQEVIGLDIQCNYFNSGVLLIDVEQWRDRGYSRKIIDIISTTSLPHHDQDALNKVFMNQWKELPLCWNVIPPVFNLFSKILFNKRFRAKAIQAKIDPAIFHYAGRYKPWEFALHKGFNDWYYYYLSLTAFNKEQMPQPSVNMRGKSLLRQLIRLQLADFWVRILK